MTTQPCPFCGSHDVIIETVDLTDYEGSSHQSRVVCNGCETMFYLSKVDHGSHATRAELKSICEMWNKRIDIKLKT